MITHIQPITSKELLRDHLSAEPFLNAYALGDLDPFFWPRTRWLGAYRDDKLLAVVLIYQDDSLAVALAVDSRVEALGPALIDSCLEHLPDRFYSHLSSSLFASLGRHYTVEPHGTHLKMGLTRETFRKQQASRPASIRRLTAQDLALSQKLYEVAYPGNWFVPRMLETGKYLGAFSAEKLLGIAGVHVYSREYGTSALGNIAVHPEARGRGLARELTSALCEELLSEMPIVTLNVKADNAAAIHCYQSIGFETKGSYEEALVTRLRR